MCVKNTTEHKKIRWMFISSRCFFTWYVLLFNKLSSFIATWLEYHLIFHFPSSHFDGLEFSSSRSSRLFIIHTLQTIPIWWEIRDEKKEKDSPKWYAWWDCLDNDEFESFSDYFFISTPFFKTTKRFRFLYFLSFLKILQNAQNVNLTII